MEFPFGHHKHHHHHRNEEEYPPPGHHHQNDMPTPPPPPPPNFRDQSPYPDYHHNTPPPDYRYDQPDRYGYGGGEFGYPTPPPPRPQPDFAYPQPGYPSVQHVSHEINRPRFEPNPSEFYHESHHNHHHDHRYQPEIPTFMHHHSHEGGSELFNRPSVRVFCKEKPNLSLTIRDGKVTVARSDPNDVFQHWIRDEKYSVMVKDEQGFPSFALVNKATGEAMKHSIGAHHPVQLRLYNSNELDESVLWSESNDLGDGYRAIRMVNNIRLNLDAFHGDHGGVHDGTTVGLWEWTKRDNQRWRIARY